MKRSAAVIAATATGLALVLSFRPHSLNSVATSIASLTTGTPNVSGAQLLLDVPVRQSSEWPAHPARSRAVATVISAKPRGI